MKISGRERGEGKINSTDMGPGARIDGNDCEPKVRACSAYRLIVTSVTEQRGGLTTAGFGTLMFIVVSVFVAAAQGRRCA
jgi:hypothetical protein